jgi:hypothetical protein
VPTPADHALRALEPARGTCFGFEIRSPFPFEGLRSPGWGEPLVIDPASPLADAARGEVVQDWRDRGFPAQIDFDGAVYGFAVDGVGRFVIDPSAPSIAVPRIDDPVLREELLCGVPMILCGLARGDVPVHAAAVEVDGGAVMFAAPGTYGKSTLAAAFAESGHRVLSEDTVCVRERPTPSVLPGPATLRLRPDVAAELPVRTADPIAGTDDRIRYRLREPARGDGRPVPLRAVVILRAGDGSPRVESVAAESALRDLWSLTFRVTREDDARCFRTLVDVVSGVPVFDLYRRLRLDDLGETVERVVRTIG